MIVRAASAQDAAGIVGLQKAANPYGDWYRNPLQRLGPASYEDLTPLERYLHGGFGMDLSLFRRHLYELERRGFPVLVAEEGGRIVGECETWLDEEPEPFGRYAEVARLASGSPLNSAVERDLITRAAERAGKLGYRALDLSPRHSGGGSVARDLGFERLWDTRTFAADVARVPRPDEEFRTKFLTGDYAALHGLLPLNHGEPARWRFETLTALWPAAQVASLQDAQKLLAVTVMPEKTPSFAVLAVRREWLDPAVAEIDVWLEPRNLKMERTIAAMFRIAVEVARKLGTRRVETYAPPPASKALKGLGFSGGGTEDPWLRWRF